MNNHGHHIAKRKEKKEICLPVLSCLSFQPFFFFNFLLEHRKLRESRVKLSFMRYNSFFEKENKEEKKKKIKK